MGWLSGWIYRKSVPLSRASGAVSNYQMKLLVGESSGATGESVDCGGKCLTSFNDLRFTTSDGETLLKYHIESITGVTPNQLATVWIKFDAIGATDTTFYMYYGNVGASSVSNGADTFIKFDDFEWGSNTDLISTSGGSVTWTSDNGAVISTEQKYAGTRSAKIPYGATAAFISTAVTASDNQAFRIRLYKEDAVNWLFPLLHGNGSKAIYLRITDGEAVNYYDGSYKASGLTVTPDAWNILDVFEINFSAGTFKIDVNESGAPVLCGMYNTSNYTDIARIEGDNTVAGADSWIDNFIVRNYRATEPAWGAWGVEELEVEVPESASISAVMEADHLSEIIAETGSISADFTAFQDQGRISESVAISDAFVGSREYEKATSESASIGDVFDGTVYISKSLSESIVAADVSEGAFSFTLTEVLFVWEELIHGWSVTNDESLVLTDTMAEKLIVLISDWITLTDTQTNNWNGQEIVNQTLNLYDVAEKWLRYSDTINESLVTTDTTTYALTVSVLEYLGFSDLANALRTGANTINDSLAFTDSPEYAWQKIISETLSVVDTQSVIATFARSISEALGITDADSLIKRISPSISESLVLSETITSKGTLYNAVYDTIAMNVTVELAGEVYECYVLNTPKFMPSMYSGFDFNSYCVFENRAFGANDTGIYELTGTTDAGSTIHDGAILSKTDFGSRNQKRFRKGYLGISGTAPVMVFECEDGSRQVYNVDTNGMVVASHELKSKEWKLSVADFDTLDVMKLIPIILSK